MYTNIKYYSIYRIVRTSAVFLKKRKPTINCYLANPDYSLRPFRPFAITLEFVTLISIYA